MESKWTSMFAQLDPIMVPLDDLSRLLVIVRSLLLASDRLLVCGRSSLFLPRFILGR
jgi:hypothetical protein